MAGSSNPKPAESIEARLAQAVEGAQHIVMKQTQYLDRRPDISVALKRYGDLRAAQGRWAGRCNCDDCDIGALMAEIEALLGGER